jgi:hypothetical protein
MAMAWWNWALILWATGATAGVVYLGYALSMRVEWREEHLRGSEDIWGVLDQEAGRFTTAEAQSMHDRMPLVLLARLRHVSSGRGR